VRQRLPLGNHWKTSLQPPDNLSAASWALWQLLIRSRRSNVISINLPTIAIISVSFVLHHSSVFYPSAWRRVVRILISSPPLIENTRHPNILFPNPILSPKSSTSCRSLFQSLTKLSALSLRVAVNQYVDMQGARISYWHLSSKKKPKPAWTKLVTVPVLVPPFSNSIKFKDNPDAWTLAAEILAASNYAQTKCTDSTFCAILILTYL